jgi:nodulation protein E
MTRRVAITGIGTVSALGLNRHEFWNALSSGVTGIGPLSGYAPGAFKFPNGAEARGFDPLQTLDLKEASYLDRFAQLGLVAALEAVEDAGIAWTDALREQSAIVTGTSLGGKYAEDEGYFNLYSEKHSRFNPMSIPKAMMNALTSRISMQFGITGPAWTVSTACSSSNHAIGQAFEYIRNGHSEIALAGGADAPFTQGVLRAWEALRVVSQTTCRPFSKNRDGLILGEGAAILVLELLERAQARGAHIYCELAGFGMSSDAHHITQPSASGSARAMRAALVSADLKGEQIGYINAHGTGTAVNDTTETAAIHTVFGDGAGHLAVSSTKSMHGHTLGAAGALEAAATALSLMHGVLPPTANFTVPGEGCDLDYIPNTARVGEVEAALSNSFAFGGLNAVLAFRKAGRGIAR